MGAVQTQSNFFYYEEIDWYDLQVDVVASQYKYTLEYIDEMDFVRFLVLLNVIKKRTAEEKLMAAHTAAMANANEEAWNAYRVSLGFPPTYKNSAAYIPDSVETDLDAIRMAQRKLQGS